MTSSGDREAFEAAAEKSGLLTRAELDQLVSELSQHGSGPASGADLAEALVQRGMLTAWQASTLRKGKYKGFRLGKYVLLDLLGTGGMGNVYLARHVHMRRKVAVKVLPPKRVGKKTYLQRFYREARAVARLDHANIVQAYDVDHEGDVHFLVMEYVEGRSLHDLVRQGGPLPPKAAVGYVRQAAEGLRHAHAAGLVHRDIKPSNLLVDVQGTVKVLDLGLARMAEDEAEGLTSHEDDTFLGTADYLAPEQARDSREADARSDIYGLGCTLYFLLTGRPPFDSGSLTERLLAHQTREPQALRTLRPDVPKSLAAIVAKMMAKSPTHRFADCEELARALDGWLSGASGEATAKTTARGDSPAIERGPADGAVGVSDAKRGGVALPEPSGLGPFVGFGTSSSTQEAGPAERWGESRGRRRRRSGQPGWLWLAAVASLLLAAALFGWRVWPGFGAARIAPDASETGARREMRGAGRRQEAPARVVRVRRDGTGEFTDLASALAAASEGQTIRVGSGVSLSGPIQWDGATFPRNVVIEPEGDEWVKVGRGEGGAALLRIRDVQGLRLRRWEFHADGSPNALVLEGALPGVRLEQLRMTGFTEAGIVVIDGGGRQRDELAIEDVRFSPKEGAVGVLCRSGESATGIERMRIARCRFDGAMESAVRFEADAREVDVTHCIFARAVDGIVFVGGKQVVQRVRLWNNTFFAGHRGIVFQKMPAPRSEGLAIFNNLFYGLTGAAGCVEEGYDEVRMVRSVAALSLPSLSRNWDSREPAPEAERNWLPLFESQGRRGAVKLRSTEADSAEFLRPADDSGAFGAGAGGRYPTYVGALGPRGG